MSRSFVLVTGATGKTGMPTREELCRKGRLVRSVVHEEDARSKKLERLEAEVVVADLYRYEQMLRAMEYPMPPKPTLAGHSAR